jgi:hypothetical protein
MGRLRLLTQDVAELPGLSAKRVVLVGRCSPSLAVVTARPSQCFFLNAALSAEQVRPRVQAQSSQYTPTTRRYKRSVAKLLSCCGGLQASACMSHRVADQGTGVCRCHQVLAHMHALAIIVVREAWCWKFCASNSACAGLHCREGCFTW